jgi:hypothetical protein
MPSKSEPNLHFCSLADTTTPQPFAHLHAACYVSADKSKFPIIKKGLDLSPLHLFIPPRRDFSLCP